MTRQRQTIQTTQWGATIMLWCMLLLATTAVAADNAFETRAAAPVSSSFEYYDRIRTDPSLVENATRATVNNSNVFFVQDSQGYEFRLVDITCFLPFSNGTDSRAFIREDVENDAFAALLATHHANNIDQAPVDLQDLKECDIRLTTELFDTSFNPISSTRNFTNVLQRNHSIETPLPSAVVGAYRSATTSPLAILSGVNNITQVSYASTSADFEVTEQYPTFGRVCSSSVGDAIVAVDFFKSMNYSHVAVLFVTDAYGSAFQKAFQDAATEQGIVTESVAFSFSADPKGTEIQNAVQSLKSTEIRIFFAIAFEDHYQPIMTAAYDINLVGADYLWLFPGFQKATFHRNAVFAPGSPLVEATRGVGILEFSGGLVKDSILPNSNEAFPLEDNPESSYDKFRKSWRKALEDDDMVAYFKSRLPASLDNVTGFDRNADFSPEPGPFGALIYDAIIALVKSMCQAPKSFTGEDVYSVFRNLDFEGASGNVVINNETGTRNYTTITYTLWNVQDFDELDEQGRVQYKLVPTHYYSVEGWNLVEGNPYVYADGSTTPPPGLPEVEEDTNKIGSGGQAVGYSLMGIVMFCAVASFLWMAWYRNMAVVRQSQPLFLCMVSLGTFVMASTIIPLSLEEPVENLDTACMASPWVYLSGAIVAFSALFAKTRGIYMAYKDPELDKILVTPVDFFLTFAALFGINFIIMLTWTLVAPLEWERIQSGSKDIFNRETESHGTCTSDNALPFVIVILVLNMGILVVANFQSYQSRNIETEYNESRYIGISMAAFLQAWCMGIPILIVVWDKPQAKFFVQSGIIFVTALAVLLLIYVPKMRALRKEFKNAIRESKLQSFRQHQLRSKKSNFEESQEFSSTVFAAASAAAAVGDSSKPVVAAHWGLSISSATPVVVESEPASETITTEVEDSKETAEEDAEDDHAEEEEEKMKSVEFKTPDSDEPEVDGADGQDEIKQRFSADDATRIAAVDFQSDKKSLRRNVSAGKAVSLNVPRVSQSLRRNVSAGSASSLNVNGDEQSSSGSFRRKRAGLGLGASTKSFRFGPSGAVKSDGSIKQGGIRITHNPRSHRNLQLGNGAELSRAQLDLMISSNVSEEEAIQEEGEDESKLESARGP